MIQLDDRLYTSTEVAEILGVSLRSVYRYIEENKLQAEVKTATGRHRFTKKNITDFLYPTETPSNTASSQANTADSSRFAKQVPPYQEETPKVVPITERYVQPKDIEEERPEPRKTPEVKFEEPVAEKEEPIDWLAKFREAAKKFEDERMLEHAKEETHMKSTGIISDEEYKPTPKAPRVTLSYYRSKLGGLKEIAQNIDKSSKNSGVSYAFTLNAGLSLYKPIKPFSVLHAYIRSRDRDFFERALMLTPSDENNAQLCLIQSDEASVFETREQLHGLFVVSKARLGSDVREFGDESLQQEAQSIIK